jgi:hypothetical protein
LVGYLWLNKASWRTKKRFQKRFHFNQFVIMENLKALTTEYGKIVASDLSEREWADKLFQIKNLLLMIGQRDASIHHYQHFAIENGLPESEFELAINNNLELRADFVEQLIALLTEFNIPIQRVLTEKTMKKTVKIPISQAA